MKLRTPPIILFAAALVLTSLPGRSQSSGLTEIDKHVAGLLNNIMGAVRKYDYDGVQDFNDKLLTYLKKECGNPDLLTATLDLSKKAGMQSLVTSDKQAHFFSWDTNTGGTMHFFHSVVQYRAGNKVCCDVLCPTVNKEAPDCGLDFNDVRTVRTSDGKTVYLVTYSAYFTTQNYCRSITAYTVASEKLLTVPMFKTPKQLLDNIDCRVSDNGEYNEASFVKISEDGQTVSVPIISNGTKVTGRYLIYKFDGEHYVFDPHAK